MRFVFNSLSILAFGVLVAMLCHCSSNPAAAANEDAPSPSAANGLLNDVNGDGEVRFLGFGDSITYGVGDGTSPGEVVTTVPLTDGTAGYVARLGRLLSIPASNRGVPGEVFTTEGYLRVQREVVNTNADIIGIFEGSNDAVFQTSPDLYETRLQRSVNIVQAVGKTPLLFSLPEPCCEHAGQALFSNAYSDRVKVVAEANQLATVDLRRGWETVCGTGDDESCVLYNLPEGLHPNTRGYDLIAQMTSAAMYGLDIFVADDARALATILGITESDLVLAPPPQQEPTKE